MQYSKLGKMTFLATSSVLIVYIIHNKRYKRKHKICNVVSHVPIIKHSNTQTENNDDVLHSLRINQEFPLCETMVSQIDYYPLKSLEEHTTLTECMIFMIKNKIQCGIVSAAPLELINMFDICTYLSHHENLNIPIIGLSKHFSYVNNTTRLKTIVGHLKQGMRYLAVCEDRIPIGIISQGVVLRFLYKNIKIPSGTVFEHQIAKTHIIHANIEMSAYQCMKKMLQYEITSLPIITNKDEVIGIIALSDFRSIALDPTISIHDNVKEFVTKSRKIIASILQKTYLDFETIIHCSPDDTLTKILEQMIDNEVHHIYILKHKCIYGVISFVDLLKILT